MSATDDTTRETRAATSSAARAALGAIRRMSITLTSAPFWRVVGHLLLDGVSKEGLDAEAFLGIGFYARPAAGAINAEAIVVFPGGASNPIIVGCRDEDARKKHAELAQNETAMFNRGAIVVIKASNTVEIRTAAGVAIPLATKADIDALASFVSSMHLPVVGGGGGTAGPPTGSVPSAAGTSVLKAQ